MLCCNLAFKLLTEILLKFLEIFLTGRNLLLGLNFDSLGKFDFSYFSYFGKFLEEARFQLRLKEITINIPTKSVGHYTKRKDLLKILPKFESKMTRRHSFFISLTQKWDIF